MPSNFEGALASALEAEWQRAHAPDEHPGVVGSQNPAGERAHRSQFFPQLVRLGGDEDAGQDVRVSV